MSWGDFPAFTTPVTVMLATSTRTSWPEPSQLTTSEAPSAVKSMWFGNMQGRATRLISAQLWGSRKSRLLNRSGTAIAFEPSGVK